MSTKTKEIKPHKGKGKKISVYEGIVVKFGREKALEILKGASSPIYYKEVY